jgi:O-antigen ligase
MSLLGLQRRALWDSRTIRSIAILTAGLLFALAVGYFVEREHARKVALVFAALPWLGLLAVKDFARIRDHLLPLGLLGLVFVTPIAHIPDTSVSTQLLLQIAFVAVFMTYAVLLSPYERRMAFQRAQPILPFVAVVVILVALSYAISLAGSPIDSSRMLNSDPAFAWNLMLALVFVVLPCLICRDANGLRLLISVLFVMTILQALIVVLQLFHLTEHLPGVFSSLTASRFAGAGDSLSSSSALRYMGSFGDYELLAEFCSVMFIIAVGVVVFRLPAGGRFLAPATAIAAGAVGVLTATRAMFVSTAIGALVLFLVITFRRREVKFRLILRGIALVVLSFAILYAVLPQASITAYVRRFTSSSTSMHGSMALNRAYLYSDGFKAAASMPFYGFGANMMIEFDKAAGNSQYRSPHSIYLSMFLIAGITGLAAFLALLIRLLQLAWRLSMRRSTQEFNRWGLVFLAATVAWIANEAKIDFIRAPFYVDMTFMFFGLICAAYSLARAGGPTSEYGGFVADDAKGTER